MLEDDAFSTSTAVTDMMTVGTSVTRGGAFSVLLNIGIWDCQWLNGLTIIDMLCSASSTKDAAFRAISI